MGYIRSLSFILIVAFVSFIYDVNVHGGYKASKTRSLFKQFGILKQVETAALSFRASSQQAYRWSQKNVPIYIANARENFVPFLIKVRLAIINLALQIWTNIKHIAQYLTDKKPVFHQWVDQYAPGLWDKSAHWFRQASEVVRDFCHYLVVLLWNFLTTTSQWLKENVFTGSLSPENLQHLSLQALHSTQQLVGNAMTWLSDKVVAGSRTA